MSVSTMKKLTVISPSEETEAIIKRLIRLRCVEVASAGEDEYGCLLEGFDSDTQKSEIQKKISIMQKVIPELCKITNRKDGIFDKRQRIDREEFISSGEYDRVWKEATDAHTVMSYMSECRAQIQACESEISALTPWLAYDVELDTSETASSSITLGSLPSGIKLPEVTEAVSEYLCDIELVSADKSGTYVSVITHKNDTEDVLRALTPFGFLKIVFKGVQSTPRAAIDKTIEKIQDLRSDLDAYDLRLREIACLLSKIEIIWDIEITNLVAVEGKQKMSKTEKCNVLTAWVPEQSTKRVCEVLDKALCAYEIYDPIEGEEPPVHLKNNGFARNFEWVVGMYSYPKYGSFDPTLIMSIFYFFIFGLMFADVGYGLVVVLGGFLLPRVMKLSPSMKRSFYMFGYCGISSVIMGAIFGGWFGDLPYAIMQNFMGMTLEEAQAAAPIFNGLWFNPINDPMTFLVVSLAAGVVHLVAAMVVQFVILCKQGNVVGAIFDVGSWWVIFAGLAVIFLVGTKQGLIVCGVGALMIILMKARDQKNPIKRIMKGLLGLYDITSYASDLLSYSRILALGLASAVIAQVVNLVGTMGGPTVSGFIIFIIAMIVGHLLNLAINILGAFVHTSRLQYLEFFGKFFEDGGKEFKAMQPSEKYTID